MEPKELIRKRQTIWNYPALLFWPSLAIIGVWVLKVLIGGDLHILIPVIATAIAAQFWFVAWIKARMMTYVVFEDTVFAQKKLLSRHTYEARIARLRSIDIRQTLYQRLLGIGDVIFKSAGDLDDVLYRGIRDPEGVKRVVQKQQAAMEKTEPSGENRGAAT